MSDDTKTYNEIEEDVSIDIINDNDGSTTIDTRNDNSEEVPDGLSNAFLEKLSIALIHSENEDLNDDNDRDIPSPVESESRFPLLSIESERWLRDWMMVNEEFMRITPLQNNELQLVASSIRHKILQWLNKPKIGNNKQRH